MAPEKNETATAALARTWTAIYIERMHDDRYHWVYLTNDDMMLGHPNGRIAITQGIDTLQGARNLFGKSRMVDGRRTEVYVDGVKE